MQQEVKLEVRGHIGIIWLNAPKRKNALSDQMIDELVETLADVALRQDIRCLVLTGTGGAFCSGGNFKDLRDRTGYAGGGPATAWRAMANGFQKIPRAFEQLDIPIIAAVSGPAIGAGCDIAAMCDIRIAADDASFAESFIRLGVVSGDGGTWFLIRAVGASRAAEMIFTGEAIDAATALSWGLVSKVVPVTDLLQEALSLAERIARHPPVSLRLAKRLWREAAQTDLRTCLELAAAMQGVAIHTQDQQEAMKAMLNAQPPVYSGE